MSSRRSKLDSQNKDDIEREKDSPTCLLPRPRVHRIPGLSHGYFVLVSLSVALLNGWHPQVKTVMRY